ncbi:peptidylprolyl isomerase [Ahrensia marina]|uniref:peptidylprolyl isomerase n=1 Tax=Ahrensia marina TaxID=1514904 RepID=UPI0035CF63F1
MERTTHTLANAGAPKGGQQTNGSISVNGEAISAEAIGLEAQNHTAPKNKPGTAWNQAARAMAVRTLLLQVAKRQGITPSPIEVGPGRFETDEEALIRALLEDSISVSAPTDDQVLAEWQRNPDRFRSPPLWEVSHILVACDMGNPESRLAGFKQAVSLAKSVREKPQQFARFAMDHSDCDSKTNGGALGQLTPGDSVPEFEAALRTLGEGDITPKPVPTRHGFHIIRMDALALGQVLPFEAVRGKIADAMEKTAWAAAARGFLNTLVQGATIEGLHLDLADV